MALRISRKVCTLGRPGALGTGRWGSMQDHSASDKSVWYALLMLGTLPSHLLKAPFRTVSERLSEKGYERYSVRGFGKCRQAKMGRKLPFRCSVRLHCRLFRPFSDSLSETVRKALEKPAT